MDTPSSIPVRSGIPRPTSRLPVLRASASQQQLRPVSSTEQLRKKPSISSLSRPPPSSQKKPLRTSLARANTTSTTPPTSTSSSRTSLTSVTKPTIPTTAQRRASNTDASTFKKPVGRPPSRQTRVNPQQTTVSSSAQEDDELGDLGAFRSASRASSRIGHRENEPEPVQMSEPEPVKAKKSRPSLSDRTIESLSQLPSSPAGGRRRRSSFFNADQNAMPPPLRPASALGNSTRPTTSDGTPQARPTTPRRFGTLTQTGSMTGPGKRSVSAAISGSAKPSSTKPTPQVQKQPLSQTENVLNTPRLRPLSNSKTMAARTPKSRLSLAGVFGTANSPPPTTTALPLTPSPSRIKAPVIKGTPTSGTKTSSNSSSALREQIAKAKASSRSDVPPKGVETPSKASNSSNALRDQIAKAKEAARRANSARTFGDGTPPREVPAVKESDFALVPDPVELATFDFGLDDPFNQGSKGGKSLLRKRVDTARTDGRLNIAAMGLSEIPDDVLNMYKYDPNDGSIAWGEVVDLNVIIAADNDLKAISDEMFPDVDLESMMDSDEPGPQFGSVQSLDFHGNVLQGLPAGLRCLTQLSKLNLSRNKLSLGALDVISQISTLRELKLADNGLTGDLPDSLTSLTQLEVVDLQSNKLTSLPAEIRQLARLRILNISENQFTTLPSALFSSVPLVELIATKNAFSGSFFNVDKVPHLQKLILSNNAISSFCDSSSISLPALKHLDLGVNRLSSLPDMSSWTSLTTLLIGNNKLSSLPDGFVSLQQTLQHADFTSNDIKTIDEKIALMDALKILILAANPLRVRKYLTMNTTDVKRDLHSRLEPEEVEVITDENERDGFVVNDEKGGWQLKTSGILDLSNQNMPEVDSDALLTFSQTNNVRQLSLQQNILTMIPLVLSQLNHLTVLDLSNNNITQVLTESLHLPKLRELRLMKNKIQSLENIMLFFSAPNLEHLDISLNRISGPLPIFRSAFPELLILQASDNKITDVSADSLKGLKIVNLSNNELPRLEPHIGRLADTLTNLSVEGNKFRVPNYALLSKGTETVLTWLRGRIPSPTEEFFTPPGTPDL